MNWLLLRGLTRESRHWDGFPQSLQKANPGGNVACLDLPGTGTEWQRPSPSDFGEIADDLRARWLKLSEAHPGPWSLLSLSMGGMVGMQWCHEHPGDFASLILVNSSAGNLSGTFERMRPRNVPKIARIMMSKDLEFQEKIIVEMTTFSGNAETARRWAKYREERPISQQTAIRQIVASMRFRAPDALRVPVLVVVSEQDQLIMPSCSHSLARHFNAPLRKHPTAGHDLSFDDSEWLCSEALSWAASL